MSSPVAIPKRASTEKYVLVHRRSPSSSWTSPLWQIPAVHANERPQVYSIAELLELSNSPLVQTSLTSEQKQGVADVMAHIPHPRRQTKSRSPSPTKQRRSASPTTSTSNGTPSPTKAKKTPAPETAPLPKVDTPTAPRRRSSKRRSAEADTDTHSDSGHQYHRRRQWGYGPSSHHNEDNWRAHPSVPIAV